MNRKLVFFIIFLALAAAGCGARGEISQPVATDPTAVATRPTTDPAQPRPPLAAPDTDPVDEPEVVITDEPWPEAPPEAGDPEPVDDPAPPVADPADEAALRGAELGIPELFPHDQVRRPETEEEKRVFRMIHFDFDRYEIRPEDRPVLDGIAAWLLDNPGVSLVIEGHCDERGTEEYNMALGERRALAARRYLAASGVPGGRMTTISYGKERPLDLGSTEEAWARNRRCEFRLIGH